MQIQTPEQNSKSLQRAQLELEKAQENHASTLRELRGLRLRLHETNTGLVDPASEAGKRTRQRIGELRQAIDQAITKRDQARQELEAAKIAAREAETKACNELVESQRASYSATVAAYWREHLKQVEAEAVPLLEALATREALEIALGVRRRSKVARLPITQSMVRRYEDLQRLRDEVREHIGAGILTAKDVPAGLRKQWNL